jgi:hypothetical protein
MSTRTLVGPRMSRRTTIVVVPQDELTAEDLMAIDRWRAYPPPPTVKPKACRFCGRTFAVVCDRDQHAACSNFLATTGARR